MYTSEEIKRKLWSGANDLRGSMDASKYKDYMLGIMFYKYLSENTLEIFREANGFDKTVDILEEYKKAYDEMGEELTSYLQDILGYYVAPEHLYHQWVKDINNGEFELSKVMDSLNQFERNIISTEESDDFKGLFSNSIIDLSSSALGSDLKKRSQNIKDLINLFSDLNLVDLQDGDVLGDAYEYLIGMFASNAGKKAGEFYTPRQVSEVMAQIVAKNTEIKTIYDPTVGSGSLLLTVRKHLSKDNQINLKYYGQEYITETYNLTRMNLLLHGVKPTNMTIKNGNTLAQDWPDDPNTSLAMTFDAVVMNPPYSDSKWNKRETEPLKPTDPRFMDFGVLPPDSKGDFAYLMHGLYHLSINGTMAIVLPHGVLFRGASEGMIRQRLIERNYLDAIIGLPANLFTNTGIPVCILILKKNREASTPVLIIDASKGFIKSGKQNVLQEKDIAKIVDIYTNKLEIKGYSHLATKQEIIENDYNLNIPRYVETIDEDLPHDVDGHLKGGIPLKQVESLEIINLLAKDILINSYKTIRPGYITLTKSIDDIKKEILESNIIKQIEKELLDKVSIYINKYWEQLKNINHDTELNILKETMYQDIKEILKDYKYIDSYEGYQIIAELWKNYLTHDLEYIANEDIYQAVKQKDIQVDKKGKVIGEESVLIPNEMILDYLLKDKKQEVTEIKNKLSEIETQIQEYIEKAKEEDTLENEALYHSLKKNEDDEPQDSIDKKILKKDYKEYDKTLESYKIIKEVNTLYNQSDKLNKEIKDKEIEIKQLVQDKLENLTNQEIEELIYNKWFSKLNGDFTKLIELPISNELKVLETLKDRYANTLQDLDNEIAKLEQEFEQMLSELVVTSND